MQSKRIIHLGIQVLPLAGDVYSIVHEAIKIIQASGVKYEVGPLETTLEGDDLDKLLDVAKSVHRACLGSGAEKVITIIKVADELEGTSIEGKVRKYREIGQ
jgi:uncharacterized protein YqgV (UPF0045/DUF77 family)